MRQLASVLDIRKSASPVAAALLACALLSCATQRRTEDRAVAVKDGDTIVLAGDRTIRVFGIDAPEKAQAFGDVSRKAAGVLLLEKLVKVEVVNRDRYGREVATVWLPDGRSFGAEMVRRGLAWVYTKYTKDPELLELERQARSDRVGLWVDPKPVAPWEYRQSRRRKR
ncbi:MAG: thermonuclease family protein [Deltaproteobacteria bacterium]|nr:thermonuclease family protein [Deltaproteobacteria bacterium]